MSIFEEISIIGLGFMGASIAGSVKALSPEIKINGYDINKRNLEYCISKGIVDSIIDFDGKDNNKQETFRIVLLCAPPNAILTIFAKYRNYLENASLVTDIGSVKGYIVRDIKIKKLNLNGFVGSHPMCGSDRVGPEYADFNLFKGKNCIVIKDEYDLLDENRLKKIEKTALFWKMLGMNIVYSTTGFHDNMVAYTSHLPHLIAFSLSKTVLNKTQKEKEKGAFNFIASGFKDSTRIAASSPDIWTDIFLMNSESIINSLDNFLTVANMFKDLLKKGDEEGLRGLILDISNERRNIID